MSIGWFLIIRCIKRVTQEKISLKYELFYLKVFTIMKEGAMMDVEVNIMLLQFRIKNYRSIGEEIVLDMTAADLRGENNHNHFLIEKNGLKILPVASIYGNNASGKSTIIDALFSIYINILKSYSFGSSENDRTLSGVPFLFDKEKSQEPMELEVYFALDDKEYKYGYIATRNEITEEWLYERKLSENRTVWKGIFERKGNDIEYRPVKEYERLKEYNDLIDKKMLVLSFLGKKQIKDNDVFSKIQGWFMKSMFIDLATIKSNDADEHQIDLKMYVHDKELKEKCEQFIKEFDPNIERLEIVSDDNDAEGNKIYKAYTYHNGNKFNMDFESAGTKKLFYLYLKLQIILDLGGVLVVDELDCQLHPLMLRRIVGMFHDKETNPFNAQLIFTSHNLIVLNNRDIRRDEIWFVEKDSKGYTGISSMAEFKGARADLDFGKNYLAGRFGAIPFLDDEGDC